MVRKYYRLDPKVVIYYPYRPLLCDGRTWSRDHYFLSRDELPDWEKAKPPLDMSQTGLRFSEKPKAKKIPEMLMSIGLLYMKASLFDAHYKDLLSGSVTQMPFPIRDETYYFVRADIVIDCVDVSRSQWRQRDDGYKYSWPKLVLKDVPDTAPAMFRPGGGPEFWAIPVFSEQFVETCKQQKVVGAVFEEVYPMIKDGSSQHA